MLRSVASDGKFYQLPPDKENTISQHQIKVSLFITVHTYPFLLEIRDIFFRFGLSSTGIQWKQSPKTPRSFNKRSPKGRVLKTPYSFEWMKTEALFEKDYVELLDTKKCECFQRGFFGKEEKLFVFQKYPATCGLYRHNQCASSTEHYFNRSRSRGRVSG